jgi:hypothetical protein
MLPDSAILENTLKSNTNWYSGIPIKNYIISNYSSRSELQNSKIKQGFWSTYAHLSLVSSIKNILSKYENTNILLDPFLPSEVTDFITQNYISSFFTIDKNTLAPEDFGLESIYIVYLQTGNTIPYTQLIKSLNSKNIPIICILDTGYITLNCINLISSINIGSVIICEKQSQLLVNLNSFLGDVTLPSYLYISYVIENRITSSLEYLLSKSKDSYTPFLHSLYAFIQSKSSLNAVNWSKQQLVKYLYGLAKNVSTTDLQSTILKEYSLLIEEPIPDCIFLLFTQEKEILTTKESVFSSSVAGLHSFFTQQIQQAEEGSLMIPPFVTQEVLTEFLFFTTNKPYWKKQLAKKGYSLKELHTKSTDLESKFVSNYGLLIQL